MIKKAFIAVFLMVFFGCQDVVRPKKPDHLIDEAQMKNMLYDLSLVNAARDLGRDQLEQAGIAPEKFIFDKYGIDSAQFAQNIQYYSVKFYKYQTMWQEVNKRLDDERDLVDSLKQKQEDSINLVRKAKADEKKSDGDDNLPPRLNRPDDMQGGHQR